jgi:beta-N-acetylhexosaminidase
MKLSVGVQGTALSVRERRCLADDRVDEVILFARNIESPIQLKELVAEIHDLGCSISIDHEGGRVHRFPKPFAGVDYFPSFAETTRRGPQAIRDTARRMADQLYALGISVFYAPVADLYRIYADSVIGDRAASFSPVQCAAAVYAFLEPLRNHPIQTCAKHFPGHGRLTCDSHMELPTLFQELEHWRRSDALPFLAAADAGVDRVMFAHLRWPNFGVEQSWTSAELVALGRSVFGADVEFVSDDLSMGAVQKQTDTSCSMSFDLLLEQVENAGFDRALLCSQLAAQRRYS